MTTVLSSFRKRPDAPRSFGISKTRAGFSLVEVSVALGIFAFSIVAILGLLSVALSTSVNTNEDSAHISIMGTLKSKIREDLTTQFPSQDPEFFFNQAGNLVTASDSAKLYRATLTPVSGTALGLSAGSAMEMWSVEIEYPDPEYVESKRFLIGDFMD